MRRLALVALALSLIAGPFARRVSAVSVTDLINLQSNGLSDDLLVALVETDSVAARLTPEDVLRLFQRGVSDRVITAMINADARTRPVPAPAPVAAPLSAALAPPPAPVIINNQVVVQPKVVVESTSTSQTVVVVASPVDPPKPEPPVYWGFGGRARPGSWTP